MFSDKVHELARTFLCQFVKNFTKSGWRGHDTETERQLAHPLCWIFPIGARSTLGNRANGKREFSKGFLQEMS